MLIIYKFDKSPINFKVFVEKCTLKTKVFVKMCVIYKFVDKSPIISLIHHP